MPNMNKINAITCAEVHNSPLEIEVKRIPIQVCDAFLKNGAIAPASFTEEPRELPVADAERIRGAFPLSTGAHRNRVLVAGTGKTNPPQGKRVAVLFSGGPAAGGHNVLVGLYKGLGAGNTLLGIGTGPKGLLAGKMREISGEDIRRILNTGGFDFLGSDRTKIKSAEQFDTVVKVCRDNRIDALVVIGGDDSNTNAAFLAERLFRNVHQDGRGVQVIGVPKTIDGDLQSGDYLPISFGFDTATRIYAEMVGNILQDTPSSCKYWHFIKLMGRAASHVALEVALQTSPAVALISEEIATKKISLDSLVDEIAQKVIARSRKGMNYGAVLVPEGLIEFIPGVEALIAELNSVLPRTTQDEAYMALLRENRTTEKREFIFGMLTGANAQLMRSLPDYIQDMLLAPRDAHGNLQVSLIPTERLLIDMVAKRVKEIDPSVPFSTQEHFFGYEGRCGVPSLFDMAFTLNLGITAASLILDGRTGYMASIRDLDTGGRPVALPLTGLLRVEIRSGKEEMVIEKTLVDIQSEAFQYFASRRDEWAREDRFSSPGPRQFWGPVAKRMPLSVFLNKGKGDRYEFNMGKEIDIFNS